MEKFYNALLIDSYYILKVIDYFAKSPTIIISIVRLDLQQPCFHGLDTMYLYY